MRKVKLSWVEQLRIKTKKEEDSNLLNHNGHISLQVKIPRKTDLYDPKPLDLYDAYLIGKASLKQKINSENLSVKAKDQNEEEVMELEFHEQYYS
jgi:hypothetical protein